MTLITTGSRETQYRKDDKRYDYKTPEQNLWRAVVDSAIDDSLTDQEARDDLMGDYMAEVYMHAHGRSIQKLRQLLSVVWGKVDKNHDLLEEYRRILRTAGNRADRRAMA